MRRTPSHRAVGALGVERVAALDPELEELGDRKIKALDLILHRRRGSAGEHRRQRTAIAAGWDRQPLGRRRIGVAWRHRERKRSGRSDGRVLKLGKLAVA